MRFGLQERDIEQIKCVFQKYDQVEQVILYGSRAKGNFRNGSDVDLTLKGNELNLSLLNSISNELDDLLLPYTFDLSIFEKIENSDLIDHIERVGVLF